MLACRLAATEIWNAPTVAASSSPNSGRLADAIECTRPFTIQVAAERLHIPADATFNIEHERAAGRDEIEFQLRWTRERASAAAEGGERQGELMPTFHGSCHCGRVQFEVDATPTRLSTCNCSICTKKSALYIPVAEVAAVRILSGEAELTAYRFNTRTATHYFCKHCGVHPFHRPRVDPTRWSVNARCLSDLDLVKLPHTQFDGQNWETTARAESWIE